MSRLLNFKNVYLLGNELIDNTARSIIIYNHHLKTYKIMIDEGMEEFFSNFIINSHFSTAILRKPALNNCEEFYIKDDTYLFYYYKIGKQQYFKQ
jgi:hypothetical protein